jgi:enoyl-CoA hydratase/carnithine racemase
MKPHNFASYCDKYESISMERSDEGVLEVTLHAVNRPADPLVYDGVYDFSFPNKEWSYCFYDIARDGENEIVILNTAGDDFIRGENTPYRPGAQNVGLEEAVHPDHFEPVMQDQKWLQWSLLNIDCPVISVIKGQAVVHAEIFLHADVVLGSEDVVFQDLPHFEGGMWVPGDGVHVVWPELLGTQRGRYFLITGQQLDAQQALSLGVVNEIHPKGDLLPRAHQVAQEILKRPRLVRRYTRLLNTQDMKRKMVEMHGYGLTLEGHAAAGRQTTGDGTLANQNQFK